MRTGKKHFKLVEHFLMTTFNSSETDFSFNFAYFFPLNFSKLTFFSEGLQTPTGFRMWIFSLLPCILKYSFVLVWRCWKFVFLDRSCQWFKGLFRKEQGARSLNHKKKILLQGSLGKMVAHFSVLIFLKNIFEIKLL